jgi:hypothetical protein
MPWKINNATRWQQCIVRIKKTKESNKSFPVLLTRYRPAEDLRSRLELYERKDENGRKLRRVNSFVTA